MENFFDLFGVPEIEEPKAVPVKKEDKKKEKKNKASRKNTNTITIGEGFTIVTGYYIPELFTREDFSTDVITYEDAIAAYEKRHSEFCTKNFTLHKISDFSYFLGLATYAKRVYQSTILDEDYTISLAGFNTVVTKGEGLKEISIRWRNLYPEFDKADFYLDEEGKIIFPMMRGDYVDKVTLPATVYLFGRENIEIPLEQDTDGDSENVLPDNGEEAEKPATKTKTVSIEKFEAMVRKVFDELGANFRIIKADDRFYLLPTYVGTGAKQPSAPVKVETYPTDATVSLIFNRFLLNAQMFGGKETITEDELINWLSEDYPEYSKERTEIKYDKEKNLIMPVLKSSAKGMETTCDMVEVERRLRDEYALFRFVSQNNFSYRVEKTPVGIFVAPEQSDAPGGKFTFLLPKIPASIIEEIYSFFKTVADAGVISGKGPLEAAVQLFYSKDNGYFLYYPKQRVISNRVRFERSDTMERECGYILVADIHSHHIMPAYFSPFDDDDEKGTRLFIVFGNMREYSFEMKIRAGTGGKFIELNPDDICEKFSQYPQINPSALKHLKCVSF